MLTNPDTPMDEDGWADALQDIRRLYLLMAGGTNDLNKAAEAADQETSEAEAPYTNAEIDALVDAAAVSAASGNAYYCDARGATTGAYSVTDLDFGTLSEVDPFGIIAGGVLTAPRAGYIFVAAVVSVLVANVPAGNNCDVTLGLKKNGSSIDFTVARQTNFSAGLATAIPHVNIQAVIQVAAGDTINAYLTISGALSGTFYGGSGIAANYVD